MTAQQWKTVETLFHTALELPLDDRAGYVIHACPEDPVLATAVIRMLEADASPGDEIRRVIRTAVQQWIAT